MQNAISISGGENRFSGGRNDLFCRLHSQRGPAATRRDPPGPVNELNELKYVARFVVHSEPQERSFLS